jgi:hypothetical protein
MSNVKDDFAARGEAARDKVYGYVTISSQNPGSSEKSYPEQSILGELNDPRGGSYADDAGENDVSNEKSDKDQQHPSREREKLADVINQLIHCTERKSMSDARASHSRSHRGNAIGQEDDPYSDNPFPPYGNKIILNRIPAAGIVAYRICSQARASFSISAFTQDFSSSRDTTRLALERKDIHLFVIRSLGVSTKRSPRMKTLHQ